MTTDDGIILVRRNGKMNWCGNSGGTGLCKVPGEQLGRKHRDDCYRKWLAKHDLPADTENPDLEISVLSSAFSIFFLATLISFLFSKA